MKVFISWSGAKSLAVAEVLREELPCLINDLEIFVSSEDIEKGTAWFPKIANELKKSHFGIICLTPENLQSRWVHFEAGVLAGKFSQKKVAPLLIEFTKCEQVPPPLSELNLTMFVKDDFYRLLSAINKNTTKPLADSVLEKSFERSWQDISQKAQRKISALPTSAIVQRSSEEILGEILSLTRSIASSDPSEKEEFFTERFLKLATQGKAPLTYKGERLSVAQAMSRYYEENANASNHDGQS
jgi:hypothetical protein